MSNFHLDIPEEEAERNETEPSESDTDEPRFPTDNFMATCLNTDIKSLNMYHPRPQMYVGHYAGHQVYKNSRILCSNCGELGHTHKACMEPITSFGIVCFHIFKTPQDDSKVRFLLIQRKHSISYIDFVRGQYSFDNVGFLSTLFRTMTSAEKENLLKLPFDKIWDSLWINDNKTYRHGYKHSQRRYELLIPMW